MNFEAVSNQKILLSPLSWGMGHVARCIALIYRLQAKGNEVIVACNVAQQQVFKQYFPEISFLNLDSYPFEFQGKGNFSLDIFRKRKALFSFIQKEHKQVEKWVEELKIDLVISDHRYGFYSEKVPSIFVTHQVQLPLKRFEFPAQWIHNRFLKRFSKLWILDDSSANFSGKLSENKQKFKAESIGILSRFELPETEFKPCDFLFVVSGPAPYSQLFTEEIETKISQYGGAKVIACSPEFIPSENSQTDVIYISSEDWKTIDAYFRGAKHIVSRAGYSTLMDVFYLKKDGSFSPTPGQAEQGYLAEFHGLEVF